MPKLVLPVAALLGLVTALLGPATATARPTAPLAATATQRAADANPFRTHVWGSYGGPQELSWAPYVAATGRQKRLLGYIALQPKAKWFGSWIPDDKIAASVHSYITNAQAGNPDALVQMSIFRMVPWEHEACSRLPTLAEKTSYKRWIRRFAGAVGDTPTAVILQPDAPFALCAPGGSTVLSRLIAFAARVLSAQPGTSVYIEAGAADWPHLGAQGGVATAVKILERGGIEYARGFALNSTHYDATTDEITRAAGIAQALAADGYPGRKGVINTSTNGHPFEYGNYTGAQKDNPVVCPTTTPAASTTCVTIGIPPTADVADPRWNLPAASARQAQAYVDAYLWIGRPWLYRQATPFVRSRALDLVRSTPWR
jgi:endoglucanase